MQDVFIQAYQSLPHYSPRQSLATGGRSLGRVNPSADGSFRQWLATIAVRRCYDYQRAANRHSTCAISNLSAEDREQMERTTQAAACETFHAEIEQDTRRKALREAMDRLDADDQILLGLIYGMGHSVRETADILGESLGNVNVRACRIRTLLLQRMAAPMGPSSQTNEHILLESIPVPA